MDFVIRVFLNLDKGSGLIEVLRGERDSELGRDEADAALLPPVLRVELLHVGLLLQVVTPHLHLLPASEAGQLWSCTHFTEAPFGNDIFLILSAVNCLLFSLHVHRNLMHIDQN